MPQSNCYPCLRTSVTYVPGLYTRKGEGTKVFTERMGVFVMGIVAYVLALYAEGVYNLVKDASSFGSAGIFVVFIFGMFTGIGGTRSALVSLVVGAVVWVIGHYLIGCELSYLLALASSLVAYLALAAFDRPKNIDLTPT